MAPALQQLFLFFLSGALLPHDAWSFSTGISSGRANPPAFSARSHGRAAMMMMAKEGDLVRVSLPKPLGIQLEEVVPGSPGVRVAGVVEGGTAKESGEIGADMILLEIGGKDVTSAMFDLVMDTLVAAPAGVPIDLVFRDPSAAAAAAAEAPEAPAPAVAMGVPCELTVGGVTLKAKTGDNLRKTLLAGKVEVYDMVGKMTNCNGGGQCGTCVVQVVEAEGWDPRSEWEAGKLKGRPESQRLSCQTVIQGDATIVTKPPKK
ncbi:conserved unknown protein [Ectocarpus siliculosus]|uniref:PDZ domain-containing protein n=1 Tax=Ectocarpus siliculosus TaxID=2880 RepID=D8LDD4_ECTSI|nr:conserved unknown protein [Ectocarpus siliculosus]|eukprot:CBN80192.1 conserved unknown protein [Ectocarpus siliculosus]